MTNLEKLFLKRKQIQQMKEEQSLMKARLAADTVINQEKIMQLTSEQPRVVLDRPAPTASTIDLSGSNTMNQNHPMQYLLKQKSMLQNTYNKLAHALDKESAMLRQQEARQNGGIVGGGSVQALQHDLSRGLSDDLMPGNLGDINKIVWPFWFTTTKTTLVPNSSSQGNITITQEAAFIWLSYTKSIFVEETGGPGQYHYVDPDQPGASGKSNNLTLLIRDSQSSRQFMNRPIDINQIGHWKYPTVLPTPQLLLPNSNIEITYQNNDNLVTYRPFITFFGLRVRIEDAKNILSTISG